ncbi:MAG: hypothetical protein KIT31_32860 [Deltaproteobacteria bacterium]|nr:hypothetical protein [Deltaproteobacteria bacterium]
MSKPEDDYLWDGSGPEDTEVARLEALLAPLRHTAPLDEVRLRRGRGRRILGAAAVLAVAAAAVTLVLVWPRADERIGAIANPCAGGEGFAFTAAGSVACNDRSVARGTLPVKGTLDTLASEAELAIADIGVAKLFAGTRVRLDRTSVERHELYLERGRMHARVIAPPRLFAVGTPSAHVTDLGCEYTLEIRPDGSGSIVVQSGKVELASPGGDNGAGHVVVVYAGMRANLLPGRRPGLPLVEDSNPRLVAACGAWERDPEQGVDEVLAAAGPAEAITVASLAELAAPADRRRILERLAQLSSPPQQLTVDQVLEEPAFFRMWMLDVVTRFQAGTR